MDKENSNLWVLRTEHNENYKTTNLTSVQDKRLSWKAKGLHYYLISRPDGWVVLTSDLKDRSTDGTFSFYKGLNELITLRYVFRMVRRNKKRQIEKWGLFSTEIPRTSEYMDNLLINSGWEIHNKLDSEDLYVGNLDVGNLDVRDSSHNNKNITNENRTNFPFSKEKEEVEVENPTAPPSSSLRHRRQSTIIKNTPPHKKTITREPIEPFPIPKSIKDLLDFWHKQNLKSNRIATKEMKKNVQYLKVLKRGTLYEKFKVHEEFRDKKFTDEEIKQAITNFALAALQPNYDPAPGRYKDILRNTSINKFIYNPFSTNGNPSLFIKYFQEPPRMVPISGVSVDTYLPLVNDLKELYVEYFSEGGIEPKWTSGDEKNFLLAAKRLQDFWENSEVSDSGLNRISDYFMKSVYETSYGKKVPPRWLHNDITFENFTKYLIGVGEMYGET